MDPQLAAKLKRQQANAEKEGNTIQTSGAAAASTVAGFGRGALTAAQRAEQNRTVAPGLGSAFRVAQAAAKFGGDVEPKAASPRPAGPGKAPSPASTGVPPVKPLGLGGSGGGGSSSSSSLSGSSDSTVPDDDGGGDSARNELVKNELLRIDALFVQLRDLIEKNANGHDNIDLSTSWRRKVTHLDATLESLRHRLAKWARAENVEAFCGKIRRLLEQHFCKS